MSHDQGAADAAAEWECPNCGATTRARMADTPTRQGWPRRHFGLRAPVEWFNAAGVVCGVLLLVAVVLVQSGVL